MTNNNDWIAEKIRDMEIPTMEALTAQRLKAAEGRTDPGNIDPSIMPVVVDPAVEHAEFSELLRLLAARDEGDADTVVEGLSLDDFTRETFTPTDRDNPEPKEI